MGLKRPMANRWLSGCVVFATSWHEQLIIHQQPWQNSLVIFFKIYFTQHVDNNTITVDKRLSVQVWKSSLSVVWKMSDPESSIVEQFVSLSTRDSIHHNVPAVKVRQMSQHKMRCLGGCKGNTKHIETNPCWLKKNYVCDCVHRSSGHRSSAWNEFKRPYKYMFVVERCRLLVYHIQTGYISGVLIIIGHNI